MTEDHAMPEGIIPIGDTPAGYSPEYLEDGTVWLLKDGKRLRLLRNYQEFNVAAQMDGGYYMFSRHRSEGPPIEWPEAPFAWRGAPPQYPPPAEAPARYVITFRIGWPIIEVSVSLDYAIWRLWQVVKTTRHGKHASLIQQFDPVSSWFKGWIDPAVIVKGQIKLRDLRSESARLASLIENT